MRSAADGARVTSDRGPENRPQVRLRRLAWCVAALLGAACGRKPAAASLQHDFGVLAWGASASHEFVVDVRRHGEFVRALGVQFECSCATASLLARDGAGVERPLDDASWNDKRVREGELLVVRVRLDAAQKPLLDEPLSDHDAELLLASGEGDGANEFSAPMRLRYGIDAPVRLDPPEGVDFGRMRRGTERSVRVRIVADDPLAAVAYGQPRADDSRFRCELAHGANGMELVVTAAIGAGDSPGLLVGSVDVPRGEGVTPLRVGIAGRVVAGLEASVSNLSFGAADAEGSARERYFFVEDHDAEAAPQLVVERFADHANQSLETDFELTMAPEEGSAGRVRVTLRWKPEAKAKTVRGQLALRREGDGADKAVCVGLSAFLAPLR